MLMMMMKNEKDDDMKKRQENEKHHFRKRLVRSVVLTMLIVAMVTGFHHNLHQGSSSSPGHKSHLVSKKKKEMNNEYVLGENGVASDIFNGRPYPDAANAFPYMVMIYDTRPGYERWPICGGILIKWDLVLTAAHCLQRQNDLAYKSVTELAVLAGMHNADWNDDVGNPGVSVRQPILIVKHESFQWNHNRGMDIGLMKLEYAFDHNDPHISLAPMAFKSSPYPSAGTAVTIMGTGPYGIDATGNKTRSRFLRDGTSTVLSFDDCRRRVTQEGSSVLRDREFCISDPTYGICAGDSGSPIVESAASGGRNAGRVIGIVIKGNSRCDAAIVGVASYIPAYAEWITRTRQDIENDRCVGGHSRMWLRYD